MPNFRGSWVLGIDLGTSYVKVVASSVVDQPTYASTTERAPRATMLAGARQPYFHPSKYWNAVATAVRYIARLTSNRGSCVGVAVSGITPTLTVFDHSQPDAALAAPYWLPADLSCPPPAPSVTPQDRRQLTQARFEALDTASRLLSIQNRAVTDIVGYVNFRLTGSLSMNSIAVAELGCSIAGGMIEPFSAATRSPTTGAPARVLAHLSRSAAAELGLRSGVPVCYGSPDTVASVVGSGAHKASHRMLYLGTFGSLLLLQRDILSILTHSEMPDAPYLWQVSVPRMGPTIERYARVLLPGTRRSNRLHALDTAASRAPLGAAGRVLLVPRWASGAGERGRFRFVGRRRFNDNIESRARAILEALGYAIRSDCVLPKGATDIWVAGGGARSDVWLQSLAAVIGQPLRRQPGTSSALGTATIALRAVDPSSVSASPPGEIVHPPKYVHSDIESNASLASKLYERPSSKWVPNE